MTLVNLRPRSCRSLYWLLLLLVSVTACGAQTVTQNQQLVFAGLRSVAAEGQFNAVATDAAGDIYLLVDQKDGVRLLKTDAAGASVLAQALVGAKGDIGLAMALDAAGNVYVTGTTTSTTLTGTAGAAIASRTDSSTNSFVAKFDAKLDTLWVTFTGGSRITAASLARSLASNTDAGRVPGRMVTTSSPQLIGRPAALQHPDMPLMPGMIVTANFSRSRI